MISKYRIFFNKRSSTLNHLLSFQMREREGAYFKAREIIHMKSQNFTIFFLQIAINNYHYDM